MEAIKTSKKVEFDVLYADGTRRHVPEGILIEAEGERMNIHIGTSRVAVLFATVEAIVETIDKMGLLEAYMGYVRSTGGTEGSADNEQET